MTLGRVQYWAFGAAAMLAAWAAPSNAGEVPLGLPPLPPGAVAPPERIELGRKLFFDRGLSFNNTLSCAMCHLPDQGFASNQTATSVGMEGQTVRRNAPTLLNVVYRQRLFHDGRETGLSTQAWGPLLNPLEMGNPSAGYVVEHMRTQPAYEAAFASAFPGRGVSMDTIGDALAAYETTLLDGNTRFDRWYYGGQRDALTSQEQEGFTLFTGKAGCGQCHLAGPHHALFSDGKWHNTGIGYARTMIAGGPQPVELVPGLRTVVPRAQLATIQAPQANDLGRFEVTLNPEDRWAYMTPTLRAISRTAPYMHDGSLTSLREVVEFYDRGGIDNSEKSALIRPLGLNDAETAALVAFLQAL